MLNTVLYVGELGPLDIPFRTDIPAIPLGHFCLGRFFLMQTPAV